MSVLEKEYNLARRKRSERTQRILAFVSIASFGGSLIFGTAQLFSSAFQKPSELTPTKEQSAKTELAAQAKGYELVLQREPENQIALEGLANVRLQMNDPKGAIDTWEKLVKLNPDRQDYKMQLEQAKQKLKRIESDR